MLGVLITLTFKYLKVNFVTGHLLLSEFSTAHRPSVFQPPSPHPAEFISPWVHLSLEFPRLNEGFRNISGFTEICFLTGVFLPECFCLYKPQDSLQSHSHDRCAAMILLTQNTSKTQEFTNAYEYVRDL